MSKFFTWNGSRDRKHEASDIAPAECLAANGFDAGRRMKGLSKGNRMPLPLQFDRPFGILPSHNSRANDAVALHDAAIKSATSLMAVMNDCLKSPQLSAHLLAQQSTGLKPIHGRPRSHTAPSTPLVEAPLREPAELEGSMPVWLAGVTKTQHFPDRHSMQSARTCSNAFLGTKTERPHSSPQDTSHRLPLYPRKSGDNTFSRSSTSLVRPSIESTTYQAVSPAPPDRSRSGPALDISDESLITSASHDGLATSERQTLPVLSSRHNNISDLPGMGPMLPEQNGRLEPPSAAKILAQDYKIEAVELASALDRMRFDHISELRALHEAHLTSLKEAHERELASHRSYIMFLESHRKPAQSSQSRIDRDRYHLTIDTAQGLGRVDDTISHDASASTSRQSFEQSLESQKRMSSEMAAEMETLKRKLSLYRRSQAELGDVRGERDSLRETASKNDRRIAQLKDIVQRSKENEKALKDSVEGLEARLLAANNERTDVLEGFFEACEQVKKLAERERQLKQECDSLNRRLGYQQTNTSHDETTSSQDAQDVVLKRRTTLRHDPILQQVDQLRQLVAEKDAHIRSLNAKMLSIHAASPENQPNQPLPIDSKGQQDHNQHIATVKADTTRDRRTFSALQAENDWLHTSKQRTASRTSGTGHQRTTSRTAHASHIPERSNASPGLGITMPEPQHTPSHSTASMTMSALLSVSSTPQQQPPLAAGASPFRSKTPLATHKKLPKPPPQSRTPSPRTMPSPMSRLQRQETLRSLSESIISSYAKRGTPEQPELNTPPPATRGRSSDLPRSAMNLHKRSEGHGATSTLVSRLSNDMLRSPFMPIKATST